MGGRLSTYRTPPQPTNVAGRARPAEAALTSYVCRKVKNSQARTGHQRGYAVWCPRQNVARYLLSCCCLLLLLLLPPVHTGTYSISLVFSLSGRWAGWGERGELKLLSSLDRLKKNCSWRPPVDRPAGGCELSQGGYRSLLPVTERLLGYRPNTSLFLLLLAESHGDRRPFATLEVGPRPPSACDALHLRSRPG